MVVIKPIEYKNNDFETVDHPNKHCLKHPFRTLINGSSGSGKSVVIGNIVLNDQLFRNFFTKIIIISPNYLTDNTYGAIEEYAEQLEKSHKFELIAFPTFDEDQMLEILDEVKEDLKKGKERFKKSKSTNKSRYIPRTLIILDDVIDDLHLLNSKFLKLLFTRGRHLGLSTIIATQSYKAVPRTLRLNMTNLIFFKPRNQGEQDRIYEEVIKGFSKSEFNQLINHIFSEQFKFINVNLTTTNKNKFLMYCFDSFIEK